MSTKGHYEQRSTEETPQVGEGASEVRNRGDAMLASAEALRAFRDASRPVVAALDDLANALAKFDQFSLDRCEPAPVVDARPAELARVVVDQHAAAFGVLEPLERASLEMSIALAIAEVIN